VYDDKKKHRIDKRSVDNMFFGRIKQKQENDRVPPNQHVTKKFPILHHGSVPKYKEDLSNWNLKVSGLVENPLTFSYNDLREFDDVSVTNDIHCVTGWSRLDNGWTGISVQHVAKKVDVKPEARFVILHAEENWTTNLPIEDFLRETTLLAHSHDGKPLTPKHGYPFRVVVPHLYFWKSAKWIREIEFVKEDQPGFWEQNGYHNYGNPWKEQRFSWD